MIATDRQTDRTMYTRIQEEKQVPLGNCRFTYIYKHTDWIQSNKCPRIISVLLLWPQISWQV